MAILTKNYRLIWSGNDILQDPFMEFGNSQTILNTPLYFETDNIEEIKDKINELGLVYNDGSEDEEMVDDDNNENYIDFEEIIE